MPDLVASSTPHQSPPNSLNPQPSSAYNPGASSPQHQSYNFGLQFLQANAATDTTQPGAAAAAAMTATEHLAQLAFQAGGEGGGVNKVENRRSKSEDTPPLPTPSCSSPKLSEAVSSCQEDKASFHSSEMMDQVDDEADEVDEAGTGDEKDKLKRIEKSFDLEKLKPDPQYADERTKPR